MVSLKLNNKQRQSCINLMKPNKIKQKLIEVQIQKCLSRIDISACSINGNKSQTLFIIHQDTQIFIYKHNIMGNYSCISSRKERALQIPKLQLTYVQQIDNIQHCLTPHFFVLDLTNNQLNTTIEQIQKQNPKVKRFTSILQLKQFKEDHTNNVLLVCQDEENYLKELLPNFTAFQRIAFTHVNQFQDQQEAQKKLKFMYGYRFAGLIPFHWENIYSFLGNQNCQRSVYFFNSDAGLINRALATIYFFVDREIQPSFQIFEQYVSHENGQGQEIATQLKKLLNQKSQMMEYFIKLVVEENKVINKAINLMKKTFNPGIIAHVSWLYQILQRYVRKSYSQLLPKLEKKQVPQLKNRQIYVVAELTSEEIESVSKGESFMFSTFVIGFTIQSQARKVKDKSTKSFIFTIDLPTGLDKNLPRQDFGFCLVQNRVIFALQTVFRIDSFKKQQREIQVTYGVLGSQLNFRRQDSRYMYNAQSNNLNMLKCFDYLTYCKFFIKNQTDMLLHLQYYHKYKSIPKSDISSNVSFINQPESNISQRSQLNFNATNNTARSDFLPSLFVDQKLADVEMALGNIQAADLLYNNVAPIDRALIKKIYMYERWNKWTQFFQTIEKLKEIQITDVFANRFLQIAIMSYNAVMLAQKRQFSQSQKKMSESIRKVIDEFCVKFIKKQNLQLHELSIASLPLYVIISKNNAKARKIVKQFSLSKRDEDEYNQNWPFFDGTHVSWLP